MTADSPEQVQKRFDELCREGAIEEALSLCADTANHAGSVELRANSLCLRGELLLRLGRESEAIADLEDCVRVSRDHPELSNLSLEATYHLALTAEDPANSEYFNTAKDTLQRMVDADPANADLLGRLASLYEVDGQLQPAKDLYARALLDLPPGPQAVHGTKALALVVGRSEGYEAGRRLFETACMLADQYPETMANVLWEFGTFEWENEHYSDALLFLRAALQELPKDPVSSRNRKFLAKIHWQVARLWYAEGKHAEASHHAGEVLRVSGGIGRYAGGVHLLLGFCLAAAGQAGEAAVHYRACIAEPETPADERTIAFEELQRLGDGGHA